MGCGESKTKEATKSSAQQSSNDPKIEETERSGTPKPTTEASYRQQEDRENKEKEKEAASKKKAAEEAANKEAEQKAAAKKAEEEAAAKKKAEEEEAARKAEEEAAAKKAEEQAASKKKTEEEERAAAKKVAEEAAAKEKAEEEAAAKKKADEEATAKKKAEERNVPPATTSASTSSGDGKIETEFGSWHHARSNFWTPNCQDQFLFSTDADVGTKFQIQFDFKAKNILTIFTAYDVVKWSKERQDRDADGKLLRPPVYPLPGESPGNTNFDQKKDIFISELQTNWHSALQCPARPGLAVDNFTISPDHEKEASSGKYHFLIVPGYDATQTELGVDGKQHSIKPRSAEGEGEALLKYSASIVPFPSSDGTRAPFSLRKLLAPPFMTQTKEFTLERDHGKTAVEDKHDQPKFEIRWDECIPENVPTRVGSVFIMCEGLPPNLDEGLSDEDKAALEAAKKMNEKPAKQQPSTSKIVKKTQAEKESEREEKRKVIAAADAVKAKRARLKKLPDATPPKVLLYLLQTDADGKHSGLSGPGPTLCLFPPSVDAATGQKVWFTTKEILHTTPRTVVVEVDSSLNKNKGNSKKKAGRETNHVMIRVEEAVAGQRLKVTVACALPFSLGGVKQ